jgi:butyryl-CoA dehydrogenase
MLLNESQQLIVDMAQRFADEQIAPGAAERDRTHAFPKEILAEMGALGLMGMVVPTQWDGVGADYVSMAAAIAAIASADGAISTIMSVQNSLVASALLAYGTDAQKEVFLKPVARGEMIGCFCLTEPHAGSDPAALQTRAVREGDDYVISGTKQFITSGKHGHIALVFAVTDSAAGKRGISAFLAPTNTEGYRVAGIEKKMGQHCSDTAQIVFEQCRIPASHMLGEAGQGYKIALSNLEGGRIGIAAQAVGMAQAAYDYALGYAKERITFGKPIIEHQAVAFRLADMATELHAARQLVYHAAALKDAGKPCLSEACMAKLYASEAAERICRDAMQTLGGYGYVEDFPLERIYRDVRVASMYEGTSDIQKIIIARGFHS